MSNWARDLILPGNCGHCGHKPHPLPCPGIIQTGTSKNPDSKPCPCTRNHHTQEAAQ